MTAENWYRPTLIVLFVLFVVANAAYLHRVPGILGDEASEGENVYQLLDTKQFTIMGERSYIGPLIDYARVPFILALGYSALPLRLLILLFSLTTFWLAVAVCRRLWGREVGLVAAAALLFSPIYLTYQRLGWAITLFPFFALLILYLLTLPEKSCLKRYAPLLAGLVAGLGMHNHILFLPTLAAVVIGWLASRMWPANSAGSQCGPTQRIKNIFSYWPALLGFWAGFGTQFAVLRLMTEDQGDSAEVFSLFWERVQALPSVLPLVLSGSSYVARYMGAGFGSLTVGVFSWVLVGLVVVALLFSASRRASWLWLFGLSVLTTVLLYVVFQFSLRYFVTLVLGMWALAGVGLGTVFARLLKERWPWWPAVVSILLAVGLMAWTASSTLVPFLRTGGRTSEFSLGNRSDSAAALVDTRSLVNCLRGAGPVYSTNVHIHNRLRYLSYNPRNELDVVAHNEVKKRAIWIVSYRLEEEDNPHVEFERCPELKHWKVIARDRG